MFEDTQWLVAIQTSNGNVQESLLTTRLVSLEDSTSSYKVSKMDPKVNSEKTEQTDKPKPKLNDLIETPEDAIYVFADMETEGVSAKLLLQIAAVTEQDGTEKAFCVFVNPKRDLSIECTRFTGFYLYKGHLYRQGVKLPMTDIKRALIRFRQWLEDLKSPVVLVCHNGYSFDFGLLARLFYQFDISKPRNLVKLCDSLPAFKETLKSKVPNFRLATLASHFNFKEHAAHDALSDSRALKHISEQCAKEEDSSLKEIFKSGRLFQTFLDAYANKRLKLVKEEKEQRKQLIEKAQKLF